MSSSERNELYLQWGYSEAKSGTPCRVRVRHEKRGRGKGSWFHVIVRIRRALAFPLTIRVNVRSVQVKDRTARILTGKKFWFEQEEVALRDEGELLLFFSGTALVRPMRKAGFGEEAANKTGGARFGIKLLDEYRKWKREEKAC